MKKYKSWFKATALKAVKTMAQTAVSMMTVGQMVTDVDWIGILSVSLGAGVMSVLTNISNIKIDDEELDLSKLPKD